MVYRKKSYFDNPEKQYPEEKILNPPLHVKKEILIILDLLRKKKIKKIVEFGSGTGRLTIPLLKDNFQVTAIDISNVSLKKLLELAKKINRSKYLVVKDKIPNSKFDVIVGSDILHHVNLDKYLKLFKTRLVNDGLLIFSEPNILNPSWFVFISLFLNWREERRIIFCSSINVINKLINYGFKNIKLKGLGLLPPIFFNKFPLVAKINYWLGDLPLLKLFSYRIIFQAEK